MAPTVLNETTGKYQLEKSIQMSEQRRKKRGQCDLTEYFIRYVHIRYLLAIIQKQFTIIFKIFSSTEAHLS